MTLDSLQEILEKFEAYEKVIDEVEAVDHLREALELVLDLLSDDAEDPNTKRKAKNLALTYRKPIIEKARSLGLDRGSHEFDLYGHWLALAQEYVNAGFGEDSEFKPICTALVKLEIKTLSSEERAELFRSLKTSIE